MARMTASVVFPTLFYCTKIGPASATDANEWRIFDVEFYPFPTASNDQIFAIAGLHEIVVCRITPNADPPYEVLRWFRDSDPETHYNSLVWTKHPVTRKPLLCIAGERPKQIQILDIESGELNRTLAGHGKGINDLAISPLSTDLLFSASDDYTIRLWSLSPDHEEQPCVAMFAGEGHRQPILTINVHPNGKWLLSGGLDTAVCLWPVPKLDQLELDRSTTSDREPQTVYWPHFYSTEVHHNFVDCVAFYGNLIISRASLDQAARSKHNEILIWKIDGFDPEDNPPIEPPIPSAGVYTRSSFSHSAQSRGFQRLLTLDMPNTDRFYQRFGLLQTPGMRPLLALGNQLSRYYFWDLQKLEEGHDPSDETAVKKHRGRKTKGSVKASASANVDKATLLNGLGRAGSMDMNDSVGSTPHPSSTSISAPAERKYTLDDAFAPIKPHCVVTANTGLSNHHFMSSAIGFSPDGTWMVGVGDGGMMCLFHRDQSVV